MKSLALLLFLLAFGHAAPLSAFHALTVDTLEGKPRPLAAYRGRVVLVVNVASHCGFTRQYAGLQQLWTEYQNRDFVLLGFPSNDFGGQEPGSPGEIRAFCTSTYQVTFPLMQKVQTKSGPGQSPVYALLNRKDGGPKWNFHKYLIGRDGTVRAAFPSAVEPGSPELKAALAAALAEPRPE